MNGQAKPLVKYLDGSEKLIDQVNLLVLKGQRYGK